MAFVRVSLAAGLCTAGCDKGERKAGASAPRATESLVGTSAPAMRIATHTGEVVDLQNPGGRPVILYFYPKDETPGCTKEASAFRDAWDTLKTSKALLVGVSTDSEASHRAFAEHHKLPFLLASDERGELAKAFSVPRSLGFVSRQTFVIDDKGIVRKEYRTVDVGKHATEIEQDLRTMGYLK